MKDLTSPDMNKPTATNQSTKLLSTLIISLLLIFVAIAALTAYQLHKTSISTHHMLMGKAVNLVVNDKLEALRKHASTISHAIKGNNNLKIAHKHAIDGDDRAIATLFKDQFRQRLVTSSKTKILSINSYDKDFNLTHSSYDQYKLSRPAKQSQAISNIKNRKSTDRYKTASAFWWSTDNQLAFSTFFTVGGLRFQGYVEVVINPIHELKQIEKLLGIGLTIKGNNGLILHQSDNWQSLRKDLDLLVMKYPAVHQGDDQLIEISLLEDFSSISDSLIRSLLFASLALLIVGGFSIFFASYLIKGSAIKSMQMSTQAAENANAAKARFLASMSHEIRTPINSIVGFTHLLQKSALSTQQQESLNRIKTASETLRNSVNDILDFSKIEGENLKLQLTSFDITKELKAISSILVFSCEEKNIQFLVNINENLPRKLIGDPVRFQQVMMNLCNNAVNFTATGFVKINIGWEQESPDRGMISISVEDSGIGIDDQHKLSIFDLFSQGKSSRSREVEGAGLGLSISNHLVKLMGGQISLISELGEGSTFSFRMSMDVDPNTQALPAPYGNNQRILLIESGTDTAKFLINTLRLNQYDSVHHSSNDTALTLIKNRDSAAFDLVILEWKPSLQSCMDIVNYLNEVQNTTPIMLLMNSSQAVEVELFKSLSIKSFMKKPLFNTELLSAVANVFEGKDLLAEMESPSHSICKSYKGKSCLVVDDNEANIELMSQILKSYDIDVITATNGEKALDKIEALLNIENAKFFDLVFMDMMMPVMDGYACIKHIRKDVRINNCFIVSLTANATTQERERCLAVGANVFFTKPLNVEHLETLFVERFGEPIINAKALAHYQEKRLQVLPAKLPGIDIESALGLLGGKEKIYLTVVSAFTFEYGDLEKIKRQMNQFLSSNTDTEAKRLAHTIKGVAGSIGATDLQEGALQLELAMHEQKQVNEKLALFWEYFKIVLSSCERINSISKKVVV